MDDDDDCFVFPAITKPYSQVISCSSSENGVIDDTTDTNLRKIPTKSRLPNKSTSFLRSKTQTKFAPDNSISPPRYRRKTRSSRLQEKQHGYIFASKNNCKWRISRSKPLKKSQIYVDSRNTSLCPSNAMSIQNVRKYSVIDPTSLEFGQGPLHASKGTNLCSAIIVGLSYLLFVLFLPFSLLFCIKVIAEYERAVIFRLGRILPNGARGPGLFFVLPCLDVIRTVDLRTITFDVPPQEVLTEDSVTVAVDAVVYYRIYNPVVAVTNVEDADRSTRLLAATTLRNVLGTRSLSEILSDRESISGSMQVMLDDATDPWGVKVERVEVKDVRLPLQLQRAMAAEAEATREANAKVIAAEGEHNSSYALKKASDVLAGSPFSIHLRYLQTLNAISAEKNSTIIFPLPIGLMKGMLHRSISGN